MKRIFAIALGVLALASCAREAAPEKNPASREVKFNTTLNTYTVKADDLSGSVQIFAGAPINATTDAAIDNATTPKSLTPTTKLYWKEGQTDPTTFGAYYPAPASQDGVQSAFTYQLVKEDNTQDLEYHNNYLVAFAKNVAPETAVTLDFAHPFAKLLVEIDNQREGDITGVVIEGAPSEVSFDFTAAKAEATSSTASLIASKVEDDYVAVIAPASAKPAIKVTVGENVFVFGLGAAVSFEANKVYTASITIPAEPEEPGEGEEVAFGFTVTDWAEADAPLSYEDVTENWYVSGTIYQGATAPEAAWSEDLKLTKGDDGKFSITVKYDESLAGEDVSGYGFLIHDYTWSSILGLWGTEVGTQMDVNYDYYLSSTEGNRLNIRLADEGEAVNGEIQIVFDPNATPNTSGNTNRLVVTVL